ncbi:DUF4159 domain-containing protein [Candidatus Halocynthiibacter alkanivorans]|uniref:DUF4159 domain-containing protein n=1 Tax=Candidatus Halocynthiibacter alkanivorans TaxID=2267619 RepID=UPI000DF41034|nr:DUF4159 domain-containing protein [Candidatus Halocynthiibacter alkanivorans]
MLILGPIGFTAPWLLAGLLALPALWLLLRAVPPAPVRRRFPGVALLLGLRDDQAQAAHTPWWLLILRALAVAAAILAFAGPVLNPVAVESRSDPLLILSDGSWAMARDWAQSQQRIDAALQEAGRQGRPVALVSLTDIGADMSADTADTAARNAVNSADASGVSGALGAELPFASASSWQQRLPGLAPKPWRAGDVSALLGSLRGDFETLWFSDGLEVPWRAALLTALEARGPVRVVQSIRPLMALRPVAFDQGRLQLTVLRARPGDAAQAVVRAVGPDPAGIERELARMPVQFEPGARQASVVFELPPELRNRISRFEVEAQRHAGAVTLSDDALKRREVGMMAGREPREGLELLSQLHYLRRALAPTADLIEVGLEDMIAARPEVIILADVARLSQLETRLLRLWVEDGGLLIRFAGPQLAASDLSRDVEDELMPVRLRSGGRTVGGAMSWGAPKALAPFAADSPFYGLNVPGDVRVTAQVLAQPDPELSARVIAALADGTPLVTRKSLGSGQVVLFHVTANAEWSGLPLSGLFVQMLERLAVSTRPAQPDAGVLAGQIFTPLAVMDGFGRISPATALAGVAGERIATGAPGPDLAPGLYQGGEQTLAVNVIAPGQQLRPAAWPARIQVEGMQLQVEQDLKGALLALALLALFVDVLATLSLSGRLRGAVALLAPLALMLALTGLPGAPLRAQETGLELAQDTGEDTGQDTGQGPVGTAATRDPQLSDARGEASRAEILARAASSDVVLAYVLSGDAQTDSIARAGMEGLSRLLSRRTSVEPGAPIGVDPAVDELAFFPMLYWPVVASQPLPDEVAYARLNRYLRSGGMIVFDSRDGDRIGAGPSANMRRLQQIARGLDIPPLEPVPADHVLTRSFYLLQDFPGRYAGQEVWVEAAPADAVRAEGMPFRNLNDNVTPVVIGSGDWAGAWAVNENGSALLPVGRGYSGERQREIANRFGINLVMHVLTGNYKSDQVHVPALLDRLGQ